MKESLFPLQGDLFRMRPANTKKKKRKGSKARLTQDTTISSSPTPSSCSQVIHESRISPSSNDGVLGKGRSDVALQMGGDFTLSNSPAGFCDPYNVDFSANLRDIPISPMVDDSVDETWDFDFDEGRGGTTVHTSRQSKISDGTKLPELTLSPRSEKHYSSLFSPVSTPKINKSSGVEKNGIKHSKSHSNLSPGRDSSKLKRDHIIPKEKAQNFEVNGSEVEVNSWAFTMIKQHSEPSLRPQGRQSTRHFYNDALFDNNKCAGPAHLSSAIDRKCMKDRKPRKTVGGEKGLKRANSTDAITRCNSTDD